MKRNKFITWLLILLGLLTLFYLCVWSAFVEYVLALPPEEQPMAWLIGGAVMACCFVGVILIAIQIGRDHR
jgi:hypothetical protein